MKLSIFLLVAPLFLLNCGNTTNVDRPANPTNLNVSSTAGGEQGGSVAVVPKPTPSTTAWQEPKDGVPRNVLDFYMMLPAKYFVWDGCSRDDEACNRQRKVEDPDPTVDIPNGYLSVGSDLQSAQIAIFKKADGSYLAAITDGGTTWDEFHVVEFRNGKFVDVTMDVVPEHSQLRSYELPRQGTTITVRRVERNENGVPDFFEIVYYLDWKNDRFVQRKANKDQKEQ